MRCGTVVGALPTVSKGTSFCSMCVLSYTFQLILHAASVLTTALLFVLVGLFDYLIFSVSPCDESLTQEQRAQLAAEGALEMCKVPWWS